VSLRLTSSAYRLPLRRPWRSARGVLTHREGWLIRAEMDGAVGYGDCAPLPESGTESEHTAAARLAHWQHQAKQSNLRALLTTLEKAAISPAPAADCAVETALLDLVARREGLTLRRLLSRSTIEAVPVNAMLGAAATLDIDSVQSAIAGGFSVLKLKLGIAAWPLELAKLQAAARYLPSGATLRLDANGAWDEGTAARRIEELAGLPIDGLEEPLSRPEDGALARLQALAPFSLALDESLAVGENLHPLTLPVRRITVKPAVQGGLRRSLRLAERATTAGHEVVITGMVESAAGLWATAQLAAAAPSPLAHGLATADWLATDLGVPPSIRNGLMRLPNTAGSGYEP
jgi:o-succinylbenzoate synthase